MLRSLLHGTKCDNRWLVRSGTRFLYNAPKSPKPTRRHEPGRPSTRMENTVAACPLYLPTFGQKKKKAPKWHLEFGSHLKYFVFICVVLARVQTMCSFIFFIFFIFCIVAMASRLTRLL